MSEKSKNKKKPLATWREYKAWLAPQIDAGDYRYNGWELPFVWVYIYFWYLIIYRRKDYVRAAKTKRPPKRALWLGIAALVIIATLISYLILSSNPKSALTEHLLKLAEQYHADHSAVIDEPFTGTVSLNLEVLNAGGYDVRLFNKYECNNINTFILIRSNGTGGYRVMSYNLDCARLGI
ncbi:MAG: hypothetical protein LBT19_00620 [Candidatus Nomurabacteria bacterium]|jgi:hypothetical protein|nr:hypothetical protein [Candidatus Nomurabacteria bacterium]